MTHARTVTLAVEELNERIVPASVHSLTTRGAEFASTAFIARQVAQPAELGDLHSFVRLQDRGCDGIEQGYNTTARPLQFDERRDPRFTRGLTLGQVPRVVVNGVAYREFLLDVNQKKWAPRLSLDEVRVFLGDRSDLRGYNPLTKTLAGRTAVFDLDSAGDVSLLLNARLNRGRGSGDMALLVPEANFAGADPNTFVYLYSKMGGVRGAAANGGFEEWSVRKVAAPPPPTAGTASLSGSVFLDIDQNGTFNDGDEGLAGVTITLTGIDDLGNSVTRTAVTDASGAYSFTGLRAGTYTLVETVPSEFTFVDGEDFAGTVDGASVGSATNDRISDISLGDGQNGVNYNFTEYLE